MARIVTVIGSQGFVGSAFVRLPWERVDVILNTVTRANYAESIGLKSDVTIDCSGNSFKHIAEANPILDFEVSVRHRLRTLTDYPAKLQLHISSIDVTDGTNYGFHKHLTDEIVQHYCDRYLILHLSGMVGPGLHKNPVYDVLNDIPIWIHPDSQQQFIHTDDVARIAWDLVEQGVSQTAINVCGEGGISPREIARLAGKTLNLTRLTDEEPRYWVCPVKDLKTYTTVPRTLDTVAAFVSQSQPFTRGESRA